MSGDGLPEPTGAANAAVATNAAVLERHFAEIQALYAGAAGGEVQEFDDVQLSASGLPARVVNAANLARFTAETAADRIEATKAFFARHGVPFRWFFGPNSSPADLPERLEVAGIGPLSNTPGMALDIPTMRDEPTGVAGLEVREVADSRDFEAWLQVSVDAFPFDPVIPRPGAPCTNRWGSAIRARSTTTSAG